MRSTTTPRVRSPPPPPLLLLLLLLLLFLLLLLLRRLLLRLLLRLLPVLLLLLPPRLWIKYCELGFERRKGSSLVPRRVSPAFMNAAESFMNEDPAHFGVWTNT